MRSAIVTGANGFIGKALIKELTNRGIQVYGVVRTRAQNVEELTNMEGVALISCDIDRYDQLPEKVFGLEIDVFYHLAWAGSTGAARGNYALQLNNTRWSMDAANAAYQIGCKRFVGAGTLAEFDVQTYALQNGSQPNRTSHYGSAKIASHYMTKAECSYLGLEHLWAYISNVYGEGDSSNNFVNMTIKMIQSNQPANFTSGEQLYDFIHVKDAAQGLYCMGNDGKENHAYYIGSTRPAKLKEFINIIHREVNPSAEINLGAIPFHGISQPESTFDCTALIKDTGYCPYIPFENGVRAMIGIQKISDRKSVV